MCASRQPLCAGGRHRRSDSATREGTSLGSQYAFCALGVGLVALGVVMILWSVVPGDPARNGTASGNPVNEETKQKTSSVAFVLVGAGMAMLLLAMCLGIRNKRSSRATPSAAAGTQYAQGEAAEGEEPGPSYDVPSYEEAVTSGRYPIRQSNLRQSTSQLPSYEDLIAAVETEGAGPANGSGQTEPTPAPNPQPVRTGSRASRLLRPLRVRRIKSEKLHVKDIRLDIQSRGEGGRVVIEPLTPPPQYEDKVPEFPPEAV
ncbi:transmembrane protein 51b [Electrophorus electricus]|uniref:transmembrane protein 51b n=1 Tax=Electrophorus electricus TaxID=8005 RepID=UPI0015CF8679|nr:transmembrane protein 51b [Electrophorus electricus]